MRALLVNRKGMTIVELLFAAAIFLMVVAVTIGVNVMIMRMYKSAQVESELYAEGLYTMDMIQRGEAGRHGIMKGRATTAVISVDQRQIDFMADRNAEYTSTTADDTAVSVRFDNGDGDDATLEDNAIVIDDGVSPVTIGRNVENVQFAQNGSMVTVDLAVAGRVRGSVVRLTFNRDILMRN